MVVEDHQRERPDTVYRAVLAAALPWLRRHDADAPAPALREVIALVEAIIPAGAKPDIESVRRLTYLRTCLAEAMELLQLYEISTLGTQHLRRIDTSDILFLEENQKADLQK